MYLNNGWCLPKRVYLNGVYNPYVYIADEITGIAIVGMTLKGTNDIGMIGVDIGYPEIQSQLFYKFEGKVEIKEVKLVEVDDEVMDTPDVETKVVQIRSI